MIGSGGGDRLNLSARRDSWKQDAACKGKPVAWFFPPDRGPYPPSYGWQPPREALELCARCPVRVECAEAGEREYGVWAGVMHKERERMKGKPPEPIDLSRVRARSHVCDGCDRGFLSVQGLRSHQSQKRCGKTYPNLTLAQEAAVFEASIICIEDDLRNLA